MSFGWTSAVMNLKYSSNVIDSCDWLYSHINLPTSRPLKGSIIVNRKFSAFYKKTVTLEIQMCSNTSRIAPWFYKIMIWQAKCLIDYSGNAAFCALYQHIWISYNTTVYTSLSMPVSRHIYTKISAALKIFSTQLSLTFQYDCRLL